MTEREHHHFDFISLRHQTYAGWLSFFIALLALLLGLCFLAFPEMVVKALLEYTEDEHSSYNVEVVKSVTRMAGGLFVAQSFSCLLLLNSLFSTSVDRPNPEFVYLSRLAMGSQSITGLCWVIAGLIDDRLNEVGVSGYRRKTFGLLVVGFAILILSLLALMMSFWPRDPPGNLAITQRDHNDSALSQTDDSATEPLLSTECREREDSGEDTAHRLLEDGSPCNDADAAVEIASVGSLEEETSRVRGTLRLLKLAQPQVMYLYIGCITLLIRLPFSLSIPHFVSTTLAALSRGDFHQARSEIFWLFLLGTIDAFLDFWCIFWFGYANQRIVRGVRIDTFAAILRQEIGFFDKHTSGELASRLNSDCGEMAGGMFQARSSVSLSTGDSSTPDLQLLCL